MSHLGQQHELGRITGHCQHWLLSRALYGLVQIGNAEWGDHVLTKTLRKPSAEWRFRRGSEEMFGGCQHRLWASLWLSMDTLHSCRCCTLGFFAYEAESTRPGQSNIPLGSAPAARRVATFRGRQASIAETRRELWIVWIARYVGVCRGCGDVEELESGRAGTERCCVASTLVEHGDEDLRVGIAGSADRGWVVVRRFILVVGIEFFEMEIVRLLC
jgi:hypothetical protein